MTDPAVAMWKQAVYVSRRAVKRPLPRFTRCSRRHHSCSPAHAALVDSYHDARNAREALRESSAAAPPWFGGVALMQLEDAEFAAAFPPVLFKDWLIGHAHSRQREEAA